MSASNTAAETLARELGDASRAAAAAAGRTPLGVRAVESRPGRRQYLCAFEGARFLCLDAALTPERRAGDVHAAASAGILWEHLESAVDPEALAALAAAARGATALGPEGPAVAAALDVVAERAAALAAWRSEPLRALAAVEHMDRASELQEALHRAFAGFVAASEPLVARQDTLPDDVVAGLRAVEQAAGRAGAGARLADLLAEALPAADEQAGQVVGAHITSLAGGGGV